jgi:hypothetical protein
VQRLMRNTALVAALVLGTGCTGAVSDGADVVRAASPDPAGTGQLRLLAGPDVDPTVSRSYAPVRRNLAGRSAQERIESLVAALQAGPTSEERARGIREVALPAARARALNSVTLVGDRVVVDFNERVMAAPSMSGDAAGADLLAALLANMFVLPEVASFELRGDGSCQTFAAWVEADECIVRTRAQAQEWQSTTSTEPPPVTVTPRRPGDDQPEPKCGTSQPDCVENRPS